MTNIKELLDINLKTFNSAYLIYKKTFDKVQKLDDGPYKYIDEYELLSSRFQRLVDIFLRKTIKSVMLYEFGSDEGTLRDYLLKCEKLGFVSDVDVWM